MFLEKIELAGSGIQNKYKPIIDLQIIFYKHLLPDDQFEKFPKFGKLNLKSLCVQHSSYNSVYITIHIRDLDKLRLHESFISALKMFSLYPQLS